LGLRRPSLGAVGVDEAVAVAVAGAVLVASASSTSGLLLRESSVKLESESWPGEAAPDDRRWRFEVEPGEVSEGGGDLRFEDDEAAMEGGAECRRKLVG